MIRPCLELLESRCLPSITFLFNYSLDTSGFFSDPAHRAVLEHAGALLGNQLTDTLEAIVPGGGNTWTANVTADNTTANFPNLVVPTDTLIVFAAAQNFGGGVLALGGPGGWNAVGSAGWLNTVGTRGQTDFGPWGGVVTFDASANWSYGNPSSSQLDFLSVCVHELGHVLGIGTSDSWYRDVAGSLFIGAHAEASYGGPVPVQSTGQHWADGVASYGQPAAMSPIISAGQRKLFSDLDWSGLADVGWQVRPSPVLGWYQQYLGRLPGAGELVYWQERLRGGETVESTLSAFLTTPEFLARAGSTTGYVQALYRLLLNREPDAAGQAYWQSIASDQRAVALGFLESPEYRAIRVTELYAAVLHRAGSQADVGYWAGSGLDVFTILLTFEQTQEFLT